jgi:hypothetical protein
MGNPGQLWLSGIQRARLRPSSNTIHLPVEPSEVSGGGQAGRTAAYDDAVEFHRRDTGGLEAACHGTSHVAPHGAILASSDKARPQLRLAKAHAMGGDERGGPGNLITSFPRDLREPALALRFGHRRRAGTASVPEPGINHVPGEASHAFPATRQVGRQRVAAQEGCYSPMRRSGSKLAATDHRAQIGATVRDAVGARPAAGTPIHSSNLFGMPYRESSATSCHALVRRYLLPGNAPNPHSAIWWTFCSPDLQGTCGCGVLPIASCRVVKASFR